MFTNFNQVWTEQIAAKQSTFQNIWIQISILFTAVFIQDFQANISWTARTHFIPIQNQVITCQFR